MIRIKTKICSLLKVYVKVESWTHSETQHGWDCVIRSTGNHDAEHAEKKIKTCKNALKK